MGQLLSYYLLSVYLFFTEQLSIVSTHNLSVCYLHTLLFQPLRKLSPLSPRPLLTLLPLLRVTKDTTD